MFLKSTNGVFCVLFAVLLIQLGSVVPASAEDTSLTPSEPVRQLEDLLQLAEAYQSGYLQVVAVSCYQLYASSGIVATDFANGYIDTETALYALDENSLLQSTCITTLLTIEDLTPKSDTQALGEIASLKALLLAEGELLTALREVCLNPTDEVAAQVEIARARVERELDKYTQIDNE